MSAQNDFFNPPADPEPVVILNGPAAPPRKRVFVYDGQYFEDPGPEYTPEDVMGFLAQTYPELETGTYHRRSLPDGSEEITFVKVTGEKGAGITPRLIAARLAAGASPAQIKAVELLKELSAVENEAGLTVAYLLAAEPRIEAALYQAEQVAQASQRMVSRCLALKPVPLPRVPLGF